jgi:transcriptional regulator with XRE-family HTH domain
MNHIGQTITNILAARGISISEAARTCGIGQSTLSRTISGRRVDVSTLTCICTGLADPRDGLEILVAHLRDEVDRAGRLQTEVRIESDSCSPEEDIRLLAAEAQSDPDLKALLHDLAVLVRKHDQKIYSQRFEFPHSKAAEDKPSDHCPS